MIFIYFHKEIMDFTCCERQTQDTMAQLGKFFQVNSAIAIVVDLTDDLHSSHASVQQVICEPLHQG